MGLLCAEQHVGNLNKWTFKKLGILSAEQDVGNLKKMYFQEVWDSCVQGKTSEIATKIRFQELWDSCAQNKTSKTSKHVLSRILGLLCADQKDGNLKKWTFRNSGTPVRRTIQVNTKICPVFTANTKEAARIKMLDCKRN